MTINAQSEETWPRWEHRVAQQVSDDGTPPYWNIVRILMNKDDTIAPMNSVPWAISLYGATVEELHARYVDLSTAFTKPPITIRKTNTYAVGKVDN